MEKKERLQKNIIVISSIIIFLMILVIVEMNSNIKRYEEKLNEMYEDYEYKCNLGKKKVCIDDNKYAIPIGEDEDYAVCDTDRKEIAICVDEENFGTVGIYGYYRKCSIGESSTCINLETEKVVSK